MILNCDVNIIVFERLIKYVEITVIFTFKIRHLFGVIGEYEMKGNALGSLKKLQI